MRYIFAGDRQIGVNILKGLTERGFWPLALLLNNEDKASHNAQLRSLVEHLEIPVIVGDEFKSAHNVALFKKLLPHYFIGIHFPKIIPQEVLQIPKIGFLNLHPAYLPYNKGWHTPSWAILQGTPFGATLHFMTEELDSGEIIHQKILSIEPDDTAHSLYQKVLTLEEQVFFEALPGLIALNPPRLKQDSKGTEHKKNDLKKIQKIELDEKIQAREFINKLRALTTNKWEEAAFFEEGGNRYYIQVTIKKNGPI